MAEFDPPHEVASLGGNPLSSLRYRDNRVFWIGTSFSSIGQAAFLVASSWLAFRLGGSGAVGIVTFATMIPLFLATLAGGVLADRQERRRLVLAAEAAQGVLALVIAVLAWRGAMGLAQLVVLVFLTGVARAIEMPTVQTVLPNLVPRDELLNIFSLNNLANRGSRFVGPALVATLLELRGPAPAFLVIALLYLLALSQVVRVPRMRQTHVSQLNLRQQVAEGAHYIAGHSPLGLLLLVVVLHCLLTMSFDSTLPLFASQNLNGDGAIYSTMVSAMGLGSIVAALLLASIHSQRGRGALLLIGGIGSGAATALMAISMNNLLALSAIFLVGMMTTWFMTLANTMMQEAVPDGLRGRISGIYLMSASGVMSFGNLGAGYLAARYGSAAVLGLPALGFIVLLLAFSGLRPALRRLYRAGSFSLEQPGALEPLNVAD
ncbi:MAG TPA: MFS transporter [Thermomicrobiaceae bacterium]|nr:MFS transporter [Thermomicrobiaceae bacterium]